MGHPQVCGSFNEKGGASPPRLVPNATTSKTLTFSSRRRAYACQLADLGSTKKT